MIRLNLVRFLYACALLLQAVPAAFAVDNATTPAIAVQAPVVQQPATTTTTPQTPAAPIETINTGEHFFENQDCLKQQDTLTPDECHCIIDAKYVRVNTHPAISELLKPLDALEKYCDYNYEQGLDEEHSNAWVAIEKMDVDSGIFQYSIQQEVSYSSKVWLNVVDHSYVYSGGAHGNTSVDSLLFNLKNNSQVDIATLIDASKVAEINQSIQEQLNALPAGSVFEEFLNLEKPTYVKEDSSCESCVYVLKDTGIYVVFQQYGVGPYSSGFIELKLPDDVLLKNNDITFKK